MVHQQLGPETGICARACSFRSADSQPIPSSAEQGRKKASLHRNKYAGHPTVCRVVTKEEMLSINGVGNSKYEKYGEAFAEEIRNFIKENGIEK